MNQRIEKEHSMERNKFPLPSKNSIFCFIKSASGGIESQAIGACLDYLPNYTHRGFQTFQERIFCLGERGRTVLTFVKGAATVILCSVGRVILNLRRVTCRALESEQFHGIDRLSAL